MKKLFSLIALSLLITATYAQPVRNTVERAQDRSQIVKDQATIDRDRAELNQFQAYKAGLKAAIAEGDAAGAHGQHIKLVGAMDQEIRQSEAKTAAAVNELHQSGAEVRSDTREVRRDRGNQRPIAAAGDRADRRDDKADKADDRGDLVERRARLARQKEILSAFQEINVQSSGISAISAKIGLLDEFEQTMVRDLAENVEEKHEDHGEIREDRHETREDRHQR